MRSGGLHRSTHGLLEQDLLVAQIEVGVLPADLFAGEADVAIGVSSKRGAFLDEGVMLPRVRTAQNDDNAHAPVVPDNRG